MADLGTGRSRAVRVGVVLLVTVLIAASLAMALGPTAALGPASPQADADAEPASADADPAARSPSGAASYDRVVTRQNATTVVNNASELVVALEAASAGDVVFVPGNATVNLTATAPVWVPAGVTLASDRGANGSEGALLYTEHGRSGLPLVVAGGNGTRITGLQLKGYGQAWTPASRDRASSWGILVPTRASNVEIDNNDIKQFVGICIQASGNHTYVHHNDIHYCNQVGLGYGINVGQQATIECNYINHVRHAVAAHGGPTNAYEASYNVIGRYVQNHVFDVHSPGGAWFDIHHNTVMAVYSYGRGKIHIAAVSVAEPSRSVRIYHNWFFQNASLAIWQNGTRGPPYNESKYVNLTAYDNQYGTEPPHPSIGALRAHRTEDGRCA